MQHDELTEAMWTGLKLKRDVAQLCKIGLDWIDLEEEVKNPQGAFYQDKLGWALKNLNFYCCYECDKPYCGGARVCGEAGEREAFNKKDLVCGACSNVRLRLKNGVCSKHGSDYVSFKCRYCCSVAVWFCFGTTHFCDKCHSMHNQMATSKNLPVCPGGSLCPIGGNHPPNGEEYALGCGLCCKH
jgi:E3 ubiquitin-protein ligase MYCBP2